MPKTLRLDKGQIEVVDDAMAEVLRRKTPAERISIGFGLWTAACCWRICAGNTRIGPVNSFNERSRGGCRMEPFEILGQPGVRSPWLDPFYV